MNGCVCQAGTSRVKNVPKILSVTAGHKIIRFQSEINKTNIIISVMIANETCVPLSVCEIFLSSRFSEIFFSIFFSKLQNIQF